VSTITMRGSRRNVAGLLRLMADEIEHQGLDRSVTCFATDPSHDPSVTFEAVVDTSQTYSFDTTMEVRP
jgi:hypothetical protein